MLTAFKESKGVVQMASQKDPLFIATRVDQQLADGIKAYCKDEDRTISQFLRVAIREKLARETKKTRRSA